ncbi:molecular chaperone DnaJ [Caldovatus sediminis]|uniref:Molecular chaperone DnaJ n=1 Tax=Caldovatus sediminis TaxID=2041189 RepID=A0A8J2ZFY9_9PROT|nr:molecular chaperone DnaJ [Caldovatus sediminis]GGG51891.1 molecular chaperone DnaJ [Caldovatus sediminis]
MLVWLALGGIALLAVIVLLQGFARANIATLRVAVLVAGATLGIGLLALLVASGRAAQALGLLAFSAPLLWGLWQRWATMRRFSRPVGAGTNGDAAGAGETQVSTATLTMALDHATGQMTGRVRRGRYAGAELAELGLADLLALLGDCRAEDPESVPLLEAWLDRVEPAWRMAGAGEGGAGGAPPRDRGGRMDRAEALAVLGLEEGATEEEIRAAHRRLMRTAHPDRGGSAWIAARLNEARDTLLRG